jgi:hypothetical protein
MGQHSCCLVIVCYIAYDRKAQCAKHDDDDDDDDDCYQISPSLAAIGTAPNSVERKLLITSTTLCPFD